MFSMLVLRYGLRRTMLLGLPYIFIQCSFLSLFCMPYCIALKLKNLDCMAMAFSNKESLAILTTGRVSTSGDCSGLLVEFLFLDMRRLFN